MADGLHLEFWKKIAITSPKRQHNRNLPFVNTPWASASHGVPVYHPHPRSAYACTKLYVCSKSKLHLSQCTLASPTR